MGSNLTFDVGELIRSSCGLARPLRVEFEDAIYHVCARGNGRQRIFYDELMQNPRKSQEAMNGKITVRLAPSSARSK